jgi:hypothetical protein
VFFALYMMHSQDSHASATNREGKSRGNRTQHEDFFVRFEALHVLCICLPGIVRLKRDRPEMSQKWGRNGAEVVWGRKA